PCSIPFFPPISSLFPYTTLFRSYLVFQYLQDPCSITPFKIYMTNIILLFIMTLLYNNIHQNACFNHIFASYFVHNKLEILERIDPLLCLLHVPSCYKYLLLSNLHTFVVLICLIVRSAYHHLLVLLLFLPSMLR